MVGIQEFYKNQIEWYTKQVKWSDDEIEWLTRQMNREREEFKKLRQHVWNRGPLTKIEMEIWGTDECKTVEFKKLKAQRRKEYLRRKRYNKYIVDYKTRLAEEV